MGVVLELDRLHVRLQEPLVTCVWHCGGHRRGLLAVGEFGSL